MITSWVLQLLLGSGARYFGSHLIGKSLMSRREYTLHEGRTADLFVKVLYLEPQRTEFKSKLFRFLARQSVLDFLISCLGYLGSPDNLYGEDRDYLKISLCLSLIYRVCARLNKYIILCK